MPSKYQIILDRVQRTPWAILPEKFSEILHFLTAKSQSHELQEGEDIEAVQIGAARPRGDFQVIGTTAILPIFGTLIPRANLMSEFSGGRSVEKLTADFRTLVDSQDVKAIVLDINSPGGSVHGIQELAQEIFEAREKKPIVAVVNPVAASAAYHLAAMASEIVVTPSGEVGSIGVFAMHEDFSKFDEKLGVKVTLISAGRFKTEGNPFEPLSDEAKVAIQEVVDDHFDVFVRNVAKGRGVNVNAVRKGFGEGRMVTSRKAQQEGMVDRVATLTQTLSRLESPIARGKIGNRSQFTRREIESLLKDHGLSIVAAKSMAAAYDPDARDEHGTDSEIRDESSDQKLIEALVRCASPLVRN